VLLFSTDDDPHMRGCCRAPGAQAPVTAQETLIERCEATRKLWAKDFATSSGTMTTVQWHFFFFLHCLARYLAQGFNKTTMHKKIVVSFSAHPI
jgi:hypothetical protein